MSHSHSNPSIPLPSRYLCLCYFNCLNALHFCFCISKIYSIFSNGLPECHRNTYKSSYSTYYTFLISLRWEVLLVPPICFISDTHVSIQHVQGTRWSHSEWTVCGFQDFLHRKSDIKMFYTAPEPHGPRVYTMKDWTIFDYKNLWHERNDLNYFYFVQLNDFNSLSIRGGKQNFQVPYFWNPYKSIFGVIFPILNSLFYHHGNESEISVVRIFKNTTLFSKTSHVQESPFSAWRMEIGIKLSKNISPHSHKNHSLKLNQQVQQGNARVLLF